MRNTARQEVKFSYTFGGWARRLFDLQVVCDRPAKKNFCRTLFWIGIIEFWIVLKFPDVKMTELLTKVGILIIVFVSIVWTDFILHHREEAMRRTRHKSGIRET